VTVDLIHLRVEPEILMNREGVQGTVSGGETVWNPKNHLLNGLSLHRVLRFASLEIFF